jgi:hypothetical protein
MFARVALICAALATSQCTTSPTDTGTASSSSSSSSSGAVTGAPLNGAGQTLVGGSRLKVQYLLGDDGSKQLMGFRDTQLNFGCTFWTVPGGAACVPMNNTLSYFAGAPFPRTALSTYFLDAACQHPAAVVPGGGAALDYVLRVENTVEGVGGYTVLGVFRAVPVPNAQDGGPAHVFDTDSTGACSAAKFQGYVAYSEGEEIPLASLVHAQLAVEP